jgi:hypothetical protein
MRRMNALGGTIAAAAVALIASTVTATTEVVHSDDFNDGSINPALWTTSGTVVEQNGYLQLATGAKIATVGEWNPEGTNAPPIVYDYPPGDAKDVEVTFRYATANAGPRIIVGTRNSGTGGNPWRGMKAEVRFQAEGTGPWIEVGSSGLMNNFYCYHNWNNSGTSTSSYEEEIVMTQSATPFTGGAQAGAVFDITVTDRIDGYTFRMDYVSGLDASHDGTWIQYDVTFLRTHNNTDEFGPHNHVTFENTGGAYLDDFVVTTTVRTDPTFGPEVVLWDSFSDGEIDTDLWTTEGTVTEANKRLKLASTAKIATVGEWNPEGTEDPPIVYGYPSGDPKPVKVEFRCILQNTGPRLNVGTRNSGTRGGTPPESDEGGRPWRGMKSEIRFQSEGNAPQFELVSSGLMNNVNCNYNWTVVGASWGNWTVVMTQSATPFTGGAVAGAEFDVTVTDRIDGYTFRLEYVRGLDASHDGTWIQYDVAFAESHNNCDDAGPYNHVTVINTGGVHLHDFKVTAGEPSGPEEPPGSVIMLR